MHSQHDGIMENVCKIGDIVEKETYFAILIIMKKT